MVLDSEPVRNGLLGISRRRSYLLTGLAIALFLGTYLLGTIARAQGWMSLLDGRLPHLVLFVLVAGAGVAAASAIWNDGLLLSWLLVFAPVLGWLWVVFVQGPVFFYGAIVPIGLAVFAALVVGTLGYVIGRRRRSDTQGPSEWPLAVIVGRDYSQRSKWLFLVGGLFILTGGVSYATGPFLNLPFEDVSLFDLFYPTAILDANTLLGTLVVLGWIGLAMWPAYRRIGLLVSWGIVFGPMFGANLTSFLLNDFSSAGPFLNVTFAFLASLIFAVILGTSGFLIGTVLHWVVGSPESPRPPDDVKT